MKRYHSYGFLLVLFALLSACTLGETVSNPLTQRFAWFAYMNGDDIRQACVEGSPARYRLVYNGRYQEQLRTYEITVNAAGSALLVGRAQGSGNLLQVSLNDVLAPWRWHQGRAILEAEEVAAFEATLTESGFWQTPPRHLTLPSAGFFWTAVACRNGEVQFNAWRYPSKRYDALAFPAWLFAKDTTGVAVNPSRRIDTAELTLPRGNVQLTGTQQPRFFLRVGKNGLAGF